MSTSTKIEWVTIKEVLDTTGVHLPNDKAPMLGRIISSTYKAVTNKAPNVEHRELKNGITAKVNTYPREFSPTIVDTAKYVLSYR